MENDDGESGGYGKPPRDTQFKKGVSGNPSGRPKGQATLPAILRKKLDKGFSKKLIHTQFRIGYVLREELEEVES